MKSTARATRSCGSGRPALRRVARSLWRARAPPARVRSRSRSIYVRRAFRTNSERATAACGRAGRVLRSAVGVGGVADPHQAEIRSEVVGRRLSGPAPPYSRIKFWPCSSMPSCSALQTPRCGPARSEPTSRPVRWHHRRVQALRGPRPGPEAPRHSIPTGVNAKRPPLRLW